MKTRHYFVSNSSSTSFVLSLKNPPENNTMRLEIPVTFTVDLMKYVDETFNDRDQFLTYWEEQGYDWSEVRSQSLDALERGETVYILHVHDEGYGAEKEESFLCTEGIENVQYPGMTVIYGEGGY